MENREQYIKEDNEKKKGKAMSEYMNINTLPKESNKIKLNMPVHYAQEPPKQTIELPKLNQLGEKEYFIIDFAKVKTIEELVLIIASMGVVLSTDNPLYPQLQHLVDKENPIKESQLSK